MHLGGRTRFRLFSSSLDSINPRGFEKTWQRSRKRKRSRRNNRVTFEALEPRTLLTGGIIISEIAADNHNELSTRIRTSATDEFEGTLIEPDWIEIFNASSHTVSLDGMHLTDDADEPRKWPFPSDASIDAGKFLVVFASGANIDSTELDEQGYYHTNFRLSAGGEFLALIDSDGNIADEYNPNFPATEGLTFGVAMHDKSFVGGQTPLEYLVPSDDSQQTVWHNAGFEDPNLVTSDPESGNSLLGPIGYQREEILVEGETIGAPVISRRWIDRSEGSILVLESHRFTVDGVIDRWSMYSTSENAVTPLILNESFEITGIGQARVSDGSGLQEFDFNVEDGSANILPGYHLGFWDGADGEKNSGSIPRSTTDETWLWFGTGHQNVSVGQALSGGRGRSRTYSIQASAFEEISLAVDTNIESLTFNQAPSAYVRYPFEIDEPLDAISSLMLEVKYDDGFVAYLNGTEVTRRNYTGPPRSLGTADENRSKRDIARRVEINLGGHIDELVNGSNVLAFHLFNDRVDSPELLLDVSLDSVIVLDPDMQGEMASPTPGSSNTRLLKGTVDDVVFSAGRGLYDSPFQLSLSTPNHQGATIYYTRDGSLPEPNNPSAVVYQDPIEMSATTPLRAAAFKEDYQPSNSVTHSYLFLEDVVEQAKLSPEITQNDVWGPQLIDSLKALPTVSLTTSQEVSLTEVETSVELIFPDGQEGFQVNAGVENYGGHSMTYDKKSMRLSFKDIYGPSLLAFDIFEEPGNAVEFDQLLLRSGSHDTMNWGGPPGGGKGAYVRTRWAFERQREMGHLAPLGRFVHLYLNGEYWGQYNLMERPNASFMEHYAGESVDGYDVLNAGSPVDGDQNAWQALRDSIDDGFAEVSKYLDVENYVDYMLLQFFGGNNWDWNHLQNWMAARERSVGSGFQFFSWDSDVMLRTPIYRNVIEKGGPDNLWNHNGGLKQFPEIQNLMADRAALFLRDEGMFTPERLRGDIDAIAEEIQLSIIAETARWGSTRYTPDDWQESVDWIKDTYAPPTGWNRADSLLHQLNQAGLLRSAKPPTFWLDDQLTTGGFVEQDQALAMRSERGEIYYTLDGSDPMQNAPVISYESLLGESPRVHVHIPADDRLQDTWTQLDFDDTGWLEGQGAVGFDSRSEFDIDLNIETQMRRVNATAYLRFPFHTDDLVDQTVLKLGVRYDDGFVAHLNGHELASSNARATPPWNSNSILSVELSESFEEFDLSDALHLLRPGKNVLAIQLLNESRTNANAFLLPRLQLGTLASTGAVPQAIRYDGPIDNIRDQNLRARTLYRDSWSTLATARFTGRRDAVVISEIMYHPAPPTEAEIEAGFDDADDFDYLEITNVSSTPVDLSHVQLVQQNIENETEGVAFDFSTANRSTLSPGERLIVVEDTDAFAFRYGQIEVGGQWSGRLSNRGETIALAIGGEIVQQVRYDDGWYPITDGNGYSLELHDDSEEVSDWSQVSVWQPSGPYNGTPGTPPALTGDANLDGVFDERDLLQVMQRGKYLDDIPQNATWQDGDWNGDGEFDDQDIVAAFMAGHYRIEPTPSASALRSATDVIFADQEAKRKSMSR